MPDVHPVDTTWAGPCVPYRQAMSAARLLGTSAWYRYGVVESASTSHSRPESLAMTYSLSSATVPPTAVPITTAVSSHVASSSSSPLSEIASAAAASPNWTYRSDRRHWRGDSPAAAGSKSHSAAICERNGLG